jgi:outer membrane protein OmpA-like peptidoglycan-associated protein
VASKVSGTHLASLVSLVSLGSLASLVLVACATTAPAPTGPTGPRVLPSAERDYDGDGFTDPRDRCPRERGAAPYGCLDRDHDGDGIKSSVDKCPNFAGPAPTGCPPPDADNDGVGNDDDKCQGTFETKNGFQDADGCPDEYPKDLVRFTGPIKGLIFDVDKATIKTGSKAVLDRAVDVLKKYADIRIEISGHTDDKPVGAQVLSMDRADAVKAYLVEQGIDAARLETRGAGPSQPIADNTTNAGRAKNRRIEFKILVK